MKDTSRPHPTPSSRSAPYRKRRFSDNGSPTRGTRRPCDATSVPQPPCHIREIISPSERAHSSRRDEAQTSRTSLNYSADDERRTLPSAGQNRAISHLRRHTITDGSARERRLHTNGLSILADVPGPSLRLPLTTASPTTNTFTSKAESPPPGSVTAFLRSIELPDKHLSTPAAQKSFSLSTPHPLCLPPSSTDNANKAALSNGNGHQVSLVYKGYPFPYDLSALPDDPKGTIALLSVTKGDPGAYILVGAHYRRTGRSRAACAVIKSLLNALDTPSDVEKGKGDAPPPPASAASTVTLVSPGSPCSNPIDYARPVFKGAAIRPAMLLLAACELDISREHPDDPKSASHASTARELFRAVYGTVNDAIVAGAVRPAPENALGLEFSGNKNGISSSLSDSNSHPPNDAKPPPSSSDTESLAHVKDLEKELSASRVAQKKLQEKLTAATARLTRTEDKVYTLESRSREVHHQLDISRGENWELRRRLADCEQREREQAPCPPNAENRVWGRLKDLLFDNLGGGMRGV